MALLVMETGGYHAAHLHESHARIIQGGTWKKARVICILPSADMLSAKVSLALWNLQFPPNNAVARILALGDEVGVAYSKAIESILEDANFSTWEYILTVESDNLIPHDAVIRLIERMEERPDLHAISALYFLKGPQGHGMVFGDVHDPEVNFRPQPPRLDKKLQAVYGIPMGCALWRLSMFKDDRLKRPWFHTVNGKDGKGVATQDLAFAVDAQKYGYKFAVDTSIRVGHHDLPGAFGIKDFVW